jgi:hypothetical protein
LAKLKRQIGAPIDGRVDIALQPSHRSLLLVQHLLELLDVDVAFQNIVLSLRGGV